VSTTTFYETNMLRIINDDILTTTAVPDGSIDLIVTSPPYNVDIKYNSHNDEISYDEYLQFSQQWLTRCFQFLRDDGRMCLNIPLDKNKGGQQSVGADLTTLAKEIGYQYHSTIVWNESNISRRTAWGSWMRASAPYVIAPVELIVILYKKRWKKTSGSKISDIQRDEFLEWTNGFWTYEKNLHNDPLEEQFIELMNSFWSFLSNSDKNITKEEFSEWMSKIWAFSGESKKRIGHPAPFPIELPKRCIKLFSFVGDTVLDPFMGSGSTLIAAYQNDRKAVGFEIDEGYCELAKNRLLSEMKANETRLI